MKLGKTSILALGIGIFVVLMASLGLAYTRQLSTQYELNQELDQAKLVYAKRSNDQLSNELEVWKERPAEIDTEVNEAKELLSESIDDVDVTAVLFSLAEINDVLVMSVHLAKPSPKEVLEVTVLALPVSIEVEGDLSNIIGYVQGLSYEFPTSLIESVVVDIPEADEEGEMETPTGRINMFIYTYNEE